MDKNSEMKKQMSAAAASYLTNVAAIGTGITLFTDDKTYVLAVSLISLIVAYFVIWRAYK